MLFALAAGCAVGVGTPGGVGGGTSTPAATGETGAFAVTFARVEVQEATDFCVDWSAVTIGADGTQVAASAFTELVIVDAAMDEATLVATPQSEIFSHPGGKGWLFENSAGRTSACASDTQALGTSFSPDFFVGDTARTWVLWLSSSSDSLEESDLDLLELSHPTIVVPHPTSSNHDIVVADPI